MFDRYMIVEDSLENVYKDSKAIGFTLGVHYPHHCGIWLSIIESIELTVDGQSIDSENIALVLNDKKYPVQTLSQEKEDRWYFGQEGKLEVLTNGGLQPGLHDIVFKMALRVSFLNWPLTGECTKQLVLKNEED